MQAALPAVEQVHRQLSDSSDVLDLGVARLGLGGGLPVFWSPWPGASWPPALHASAMPVDNHISWSMGHKEGFCQQLGTRGQEGRQLMVAGEPDPGFLTTGTTFGSLKGDNTIKTSRVS